MANRENAQKLLDTVNEHIGAFDMGTWVAGYIHPGEPDFILGLDNIKDGRRWCGTTLCLAGFAGLLSGNQVRYSQAGKIRLTKTGREDRLSSWQSIGEEYLGISPRLGDYLFYAPEREALDALRMIADGWDESEVIQCLVNQE